MWAKERIGIERGKKRFSESIHRESRRGGVWGRPGKWLGSTLATEMGGKLQEFLKREGLYQSRGGDLGKGDL